MGFDLGKMLGGVGNAATVAFGPLGLMARGVFEGGKALGATDDPAAQAQQESMASISDRLRPEFKSGVDANGKLLNSNIADLQSKLGNINLNTQGLEAIRGRALGTGPSAWANMATQKQGLEEQQARDQGAAQGASAQAQARSQLAMRGGLSGGARQRLAMQGSRDQAAQGQQIGAQGQAARANIGLQDEQQRTSLLSQLPGMENQALQPEFQKVNAWQQMAGQEQQLGLQGQQAQNAANMETYKQKMASMAADRQASATEKSGQK